MTTKRLRTTSCIVAALLMSGCGGKVHYPNYYTLAVAPTQNKALSAAHTSATVAVRRFETPAYLRQGRIVYRQTPEEVGFYDYHRWAADPGLVITAGVIDSLRSANLFSVVEPYDGQERPDYVVNGRLERLDEVDYGDHVQVEVKLSSQLVNTRTGASVWAGSVTQTSNVDARNVNSVVVAMNRAVQEAIAEMMANLEKQLADAAVAAQYSGAAETETK